MNKLAEKIWHATAEFSGSKEEYCALVQSAIDQHFKEEAEKSMTPEMLDSSKGPKPSQSLQDRTRGFRTRAIGNEVSNTDPELYIMSQFAQSENYKILAELVEEVRQVFEFIGEENMTGFSALSEVENIITSKLKDHE